jgi:NAD(P)-dependent dehydrogenase (short-subunit alcohol dehydrogenase family)
VELFVADLGVQADVRRAAGEILARFPRLDVLLNNAGVFQTRFVETVDGIETMLAVNHLAYFLLTELLRERLAASAPARIVSVASDAHRFARLDLDDLEFRSRPFAAMRVYGTSKLLNVMWNAELARRLEGSGVSANCLHPGGVNTGLGDQNGGMLAQVGGLVKRFLRSPDKGAETSVHLATAPQLVDVSGRYFANCRERRPSAAARDASAQARLWELSEALVSRSA